MSNQNDFLTIETSIVEVLKTIYDPEIPVNIYDLGLIYNIDVDDEQNVNIDMTLTALNCPIADDLLMMVKNGVQDIPEVKTVNVNLVFDPPWTKESMSEEALLELGLL